MAGNIEVSISAKTIEFTAGAAQAQASARLLSADLNALARQSIAAGADMKASLHPQLLAAADAFATAQAKLAFYRDGLRASSEAARAAAEAHAGLSLATSAVTREYVVLGHEAMQGEFSRLPGAIIVLLERMGALDAIIKGTTLTMVAGGAAALGLAAGIAAIALSSSRAQAALDTARDAFSFKGIIASDAAIAAFAAQLHAIPGVSTEAATAITHAFADMQGATLPVMKAMVDILPDVMKGTGKDAQAAAKMLADEWSAAIKASTTPEEAARAFFGKYIQAIAGMATANAAAIKAALDQAGGGAVASSMLDTSAASQAKQTADDIAAAIKNANTDIKVSDEAALAAFKQTEEARAATYRVQMDIVRKSVEAEKAALSIAQAAEETRLAALKASEDGLAESYRSQMALVKQSVAAAHAYSEAWHKTTEDVQAAFNEITKAGGEIAKMQGAAAAGGGGAKGSILGLFGIGDAGAKAQQEIAALTSSMEQQLGELRNAFAQAVPAGDFDQAIAALDQFKGGLADIPALMEQIGAADQTQFAAIIANLEKARVAQQQYADEVKKVQQQAATATAAEWQAALRPIGTAFEGIVTGMLTRGQTLEQGLVRAADQIATGLISAATKGAVSWAATEVSKTLATDTGVAARTAAENAGNVTFLGQITKSLASWLGLETSKTAATTAGAAMRESVVTGESVVASAVEISKAMASISVSAAEAAAAAFADSAMLGPAGLAAAPGVAAAAYGATMSWATGMGVAKLATGTLSVPQDMLAIVHQGEMIVPAAIAQYANGAQPTPFPTGGSSAAPGSSGSSGGGGTVINVTLAPQISALDGQSVVAILNNPSIMRSLAINLGNYYAMNPSTRPPY